jgi:hypothetical protein
VQFTETSIHSEYVPVARLPEHGFRGTYRLGQLLPRSAVGAVGDRRVLYVMQRASQPQVGRQPPTLEDRHRNARPNE